MEILIKEACHENWNSMSPNEQGAFCSKCVKTVIDFTDKSLEEIKSFFAGRGQESTCGRFENRQLSALSFDAFFERFRHFEFTKRFAIILYFTFGMWLFGNSSALAQSDTLFTNDTVVKAPEVISLPQVQTYTNIAIAELRPEVMMGTVAIIVQPKVFDWNKITVSHQVWVAELPKKGVRLPPLKREPVYRRRD